MKNLTILFIMLLPLLSWGQDDSELKEDLSYSPSAPYEAYIQVGGSSYEGDLHCFDDENLDAFTDVGFSFGLGVKKQFKPNLSLGFEYNMLSISANEADFASEGHQRRGYGFENTLHELVLIAEYTPFAKKDWIVQPYLFGGLGLAFSNSKNTFGDSDVGNLNPSVELDIAEKKKTSFTLPLGLGLKSDLSDRASLSIQAGIRFANNDYIDGISKAGNSEIGDYYGSGVVRFGWKF